MNPHLCATPEHQPSYVVADVGRVFCPVCQADVPSPRPSGPQHAAADVGERVPVRESFGRPKTTDPG